MPPDRKGIAVVENCTAVLCSSMNVSSMDKAQQVFSALHRRPLPALLEWHTGPMPFGHGPTHPSQRVGNMIGANSGGLGNLALTIRVKQTLRCLTGRNRPVDPQRLQRLGLRQTHDLVVDRLQDVAAEEIEAGNSICKSTSFSGDDVAPAM